MWKRGIIAALCVVAFLGAAVVQDRPPASRPAGKASLAGVRITLDPGHGGSDPGTHGKVTGIYEKDITLPVALKAKALLEAKGAIVTLTRTTDRDVYGPLATAPQELQARVNIAVQHHADLFVSLHANACADTKVGGVTSYDFPQSARGNSLAQALQNRLVQTANRPDRGIQPAGFYVLKYSPMPAALVEMLFLSNPQEEALLRQKPFQDKLANALALGIEDYVHPPARPQPGRKGATRTTL